MYIMHMQLQAQTCPGRQVDVADMIKNFPALIGFVTSSGNSNYDWLSSQCCDMKERGNGKSKYSSI